MTATESPRLTPPVLIAAPRPAITPQPSRPATSGGTAGSTLVHWPAATRVCSTKAPMPSAGDSGVPSSRVIFCCALWVAKQYLGRPGIWHQDRGALDRFSLCSGDHAPHASCHPAIVLHPPAVSQDRSTS